MPVGVAYEPGCEFVDEAERVDVEEMGGLHIIGSERHESWRIDRQLRGRAGRQGDPGASQFFLSLEDDLMRLFGSDRIAKLMDRMGAQDGEVLTHPLITRSIEQAQKRVELQNFQSRKRLLDYDDVMNQQREVIYSLRSFALEGGEELKGEALKMVEKAVARRVETALAEFDSPDASVLKQNMDLTRQLVKLSHDVGGSGVVVRAPERRTHRARAHRRDRRRCTHPRSRRARGRVARPPHGASSRIALPPTSARLAIPAAGFYPQPRHGAHRNEIRRHIRRIGGRYRACGLHCEGAPWANLVPPHIKRNCKKK